MSKVVILNWCIRHRLLTVGVTLLPAEGRVQLQVALQGEPGNTGSDGDMEENDDTVEDDDENELMVLDPAHVSVLNRNHTV